MSDIAKLRIAEARLSRLRLFEIELGVLHAGSVDYVLGLNPSSSLLLDLIAEHPNSDDDVLAGYAKGLDIDTKTAGEFITMLVQSWQELAGAFTDHAVGTPPALETEPLFDKAIAFGGGTVRLLIHDQAMADLIAPVIEGLGVDTANKQPCVTVQRADDVVYVTTFDGQVHFSKNDLLARGEILTALVEAAFPLTIGYPHVHGATLLSPKGKQILVTGDSGQGKTTLALGLAALGFTLWADDFSIFMPDNKNLVPIHFNPSVKQGAWGALDGFYPNLADLPAIEQGDRTCKYLARVEPPDTDLIGRPVDLVVFPNWDPDATPSIELYDQGTAIISLLRHSHLPKNEANLQAMMDHLAGADIWLVTYSTFQEARDLIEGALS